MDIGATLRSLRPDRSRLVVRLYRWARRFAERLGVQFVMRSFYTPIPELRRLSEADFARRSELRGIEIDLDAQAAYVEGELAPYLVEFPPAAPVTPFDIDNGSYSRVDADVLYATVRALKPKRILELGSGHSTLIMAEAASANARDGHAPELIACDPFPGVAQDGLPGLTRLDRTPAQEVSGELFDSLGAGDLLFVDTTHTVKLGSDVNFVVLDVLPRLAPGVLVHFHDIFLPYEYPRHWLEDLGLYWAEQYLLQAFLACNHDFEVVCALHALARERPQVLERYVRSWRPGVAPGGFWIRRTG